MKKITKRRAHRPRGSRWRMIAKRLVGAASARQQNSPLPRVATLRGQSMPRDVAYFCSIMLAVAATRVNADIRRRVVLNGAWARVVCGGPRLCSPRRGRRGAIDSPKARSYRR